MKIVELHCDTVMNIEGLEGENTLYSNSNSSIDFKRMKKANIMTQFFAIFLPSEEYKTEDYPGDDPYIRRKIGLVKGSVAMYPELIAMAYSYKDIIENDKKGLMSALLTIEDGRSIDGKFEKIKGYHSLGIRQIGLTWNSPNSLGYPNSKDAEIMKKGLTDFGKEAIEYMNELGMIVDVSHLSDGGFYDVLDISSKPFMASHSNARAISPHQRNLTDQMIKALGEKGGVAGLNFAPFFLNEDISNMESRIDMMVAHLNHMKNKGGEDLVALGSDFDGIDGDLEIASTDQLHLLIDRLEKEGWNQEQIEKFAYKNALRVIKENLD